MRKIIKAECALDKYLCSLLYENLISERLDKVYGIVFTNIAKIITEFYSAIDVTSNIDLSISSNTIGDISSIIITGYVKVEDGRFLHIEKTCLPGGCRDE